MLLPCLSALSRGVWQVEVWRWPQDMGRVGRQGQGWDTSARWGGRLATAQLPQEEACGWEEGGDSISGALEGSFS